MIPIRIDLEIPSFRPEAPLPTPSNAREYGIDESLPAYKQPDPTPIFRLHDQFLWNLHEALMTPDQFAKKFVEELDLPYHRRYDLISQISAQIRQQLEEYAGVALHPLFHSASTDPAHGPSAIANAQVQQSAAPSQAQTPAPRATATPAPGLPTETASTPLAQSTITATATPLPASTPNPTSTTHPEPTNLSDPNDIHNPDDTYRCLIHLSISHSSHLYTDKFEWSLLHPPGLAEIFAARTAADFGLAGEWVSAISHAIYEAVLRLKKEVCENGGLLLGYGELNNESLPAGYGGPDGVAGGAEAGWRWDPETLGVEWEPRIEALSKEEIEKREGDRERQLRRVRRETARFSSTANTGLGRVEEIAVEEERMGRGERRKTKRRFRSLSPSGRDTPDAQGYGGGAGTLTEEERKVWRCAHCAVWGPAVWAVRDGPAGPKVSLTFLW